ncbi:Lysyl oxidase-like 2 isoform X1 [Oopsacas minuta]|uniref:Lysyl oxidase-like 2 isoform X1 n=1 Tax=Oopsacas minuta TaxID=111878 RepID=A0AAV7KJY3_9METZ|nr:Lysyl oxidase-like 2 isoform X1 [Oopsacas minuta]
MLLILISCILQGILFTNVHTVRSYVDGDVRLADAQYRVSAYYNRQYVFGRVEVSFESNWGTVCWNRWSFYESRTVCTEIGYHRPSDWSTAGPNRIIQDDRVILLDNLYCNGEDRLIDCRHNGYNNVRERCTHYDDVWVECYRDFPVHVSDLPIRLISQQAINAYNSQNNTYLNENDVVHAGLIQAKLNGDWYYISGVGWDLVDARISCRQLGYPDVNYIPEYDPEIALSEDQLIQVTMENLDCVSNERELKECYHDGWLVSDYDVTNLASVNCVTKEQFLSSKETLFRLRGGSSYWEGRLEILHELSWGTICSKDFTLTHADIACKSLGLGRAEEMFNTASSGYGRGIGEIWIGDFDCSNPLSADSLLDCDSSDWGYSTCRYDHAWDVGIKCQVPRPERKIRMLRQYISRQYTMPGVKFYYTEIYHENTWSSPCCYSLLPRISTNRLCRELGLGFGLPYLSRCETDPNKSQQSGLSGYILCYKQEYFSENCLSQLTKLDQCYYGYDVIACADRPPSAIQ